MKHREYLFLNFEAKCITKKYEPQYYGAQIFVREDYCPPKEGMKLIDVDDKEYDYLGSNVLALAPRVCVVLNGNHVIIQKLRDEGCIVHTYEGHEMSFRDTGGPTCLTCPITRE